MQSTTRTAPAAGAEASRLRFAFASCQNWPNGYFSAYRRMAEEDLDLVLHLGDYIYEAPIGATTKRAALARADRVVVLAEGQVAAVGPWRELESGWGHLAG